MMRAYYDADGSRALAARTSAERTESFFSMQFVTRKSIFIVLVLATVLVMSGCVYRANISQGNIVEEEDLDQVEVGMTRNQIRFLLGTPMVDDPFRKNRWDYVYYVKIGRNDASAKRWISIVFDEDRVSEIRRNQELNPAL
jgi:outer membrane protein assembly factor BamE